MTKPACIYRWYLDNTYLQTEFVSLRALVRTAFEGAEAKRTVPGAATLLRELRRSAAQSAPTLAQGTATSRPGFR